MDHKVIGGILMIMGTTVGAGLLALPIASAGVGFPGSFLLLILCWAVMTFSAFWILEANLWFATESNLISMTRATLGKPGAAIAWLSCLLLLYSLVCAYVSVGADILTSFLTVLHIQSPLKLGAIIFTLIFGGVVFRGIHSVDLFNRGLMSGKIIILLILIISLLSCIQGNSLAEVHWPALPTAVTVTITSFGFATLVPSLRYYFQSDVKKLKIVLLVGTLLPLIFYSLWDMVVLGSVPHHGVNGLEAINASAQPTSGLMAAVSSAANHPWVTTIAHIFVTICVLTSFLGVSLSLWDFLADGLSIPKQGKSKFAIAAVTFLPPLCVVLIAPSIFIKSLQYAGVFTVVLLILIPALMVWKGRYLQKREAAYRVWGGQAAIICVVAFSCVSIILGLREAVGL